MALAAPRPCCHPGCGVLVRDGNARCIKHRQQVQREIDARRGTAHERGYTSKWRVARETFLRAHPLCAECARQGKLIAASVIDHIVPHKGDKARFWDSTNWQPLCKSCHDSKTAREDGRWGGQVGRAETLGR